MAKEDVIELEGLVEEILPGGGFKVRLETSCPFKKPLGGVLGGIAHIPGVGIVAVGTAKRTAGQENCVAQTWTVQCGERFKGMDS